MKFYSGSRINPTDFLQRWGRLGDRLGIDLYVQRDDLLPAPLAGNKWIKLLGEVANTVPGNEVYISNGGIDSNHCRTIALWGAQMGISTHMVLHGDPKESLSENTSLKFLQRLESKFDVVAAHNISARIDQLVQAYDAIGLIPRVIPGGGHSLAGISAYKAYAVEVIAAAKPDVIVHASGTGGTQAGIIAACRANDSRARVIGISVARSRRAGIRAISESLEWLGVTDTIVDFRDDYIDGGYGRHEDRTNSAVRLGWQYGMPLDHVYTGKAFAALMDLSRTGEILPGARVLFWHTGGSYIAYAA